jgi:hypothetical protein
MSSPRQEVVIGCLSITQPCAINPAFDVRRTKFVLKTHVGWIAS